jgi:hypothetical protein
VDNFLERFTKPGFTINAKKGSFCQAVVTSLGYNVSPQGVHSDLLPVAAILNYPPSRNEEQLWHVLRTRKYHHSFIINYDMYVVPLFTSNEERSKWSWADQMQKLSSHFAKISRRAYISYTPSKDSICYIQGRLQIRNKQYPYPVRLRWINLIISAASCVLNSVERKYSTCEQELLPLVCSLEMYRIYIYGGGARGSVVC